MKIAILYGALDVIGGAEIVVLLISRELNIPIYTTDVDRNKIKKMGFSDENIISIGKIPKGKSRQESISKKFRNLNLKKKYDLYILSGEWIESASVNNKPNILYAHSILNDVFDRYGYIRRNFFDEVLWNKDFNARAFFKRTKFDLQIMKNRFLERFYIRHVNKIISSSVNTQKKMKKYLKRDSSLIYPPVETKEFKYKKNEDFWLSVNRLYWTKRVEIQMKAFAKIPKEKLIIVGSYENSKSFLDYKRYLEGVKPKNVEIVSDISEKELIELYSNCKGVISTAKDEDFGLTAIEAMASGKPVIAANEGGYKETIVDDVTGRLIDDIDDDKLVEAIKEVGANPKKYKIECLKQSKKFDIEIFINKFKKEIGI